MIERYFQTIEDFMIKQKLCILLNFASNEEIDIPTFLNDIYTEFNG